MDFRDWRPHYQEILAEFGFDGERDEEAARVLASRLPGGPPDLEVLESLLRGRIIHVVGGSGTLEAEGPIQGTVIAADGATSLLLRMGILPDIIVTDLDGHVPDQVEANGRGAVVLVHAHGDNIPRIETWTGRFPGRVFGTTQAGPLGNVLNFGGFTDGDRGVFLARHFGAGEIRLLGFDFDRVGTLKDTDRAVKLKKLEWARYLIETVLGVTLPGSV